MKQFVKFVLTLDGTPQVCVVEEPRDIVAVERTQEYKGFYHVLQEAINPIDGIGPEQLRVKELLATTSRRPYFRGDSIRIPILKVKQPPSCSVTRASRFVSYQNCEWPTCWWRS